MRLKRLQQKTCFATGVAGCVAFACAGILMLLGVGAASLLRAIGFVLVGAMPLFLALVERGANKNSRRGKLLGLFALWVISYFELPPLSGIAGAMVMPAITAMYRNRKFRTPWVVLLAAEVLYAVAVTLYIPYTFAAAAGEQASFPYHFPIQWMGAVLLLVALARGLLLVLLYRAAAKEPVAQEDVIHRLR